MQIGNWIKLPKITGMGHHRLVELAPHLQIIFTDYTFLLIPKGTVFTTGILDRTTLYIRYKDK